MTCGNGELDAGERCDDGNLTAGDGCDASCQPEENFGCIGEPSECFPALASVRDGELTNADMNWSRPGAPCIRSSRNVPFETLSYTNTSAETIQVDVGTTFSDFDGYLTVFIGDVDAMNPTVGCVDGDDDFDGRNSSFVANVEVPAGATVTAVASPYSTGRGVFAAAIFPAGVHCGNGMLESTDLDELCDDGNSDAGDGCSERCIVEFGFRCKGRPSVCTPTCGNGLIDGLEDCDDGNTEAGDGCSDSCTVEAGYNCIGRPSMCAMATCGNGVVEIGEVCDDGNTDAGDGCEADCLTAVFSGEVAEEDPTWARTNRGCTGSVPGVHFDAEGFVWNGTWTQELAFTVSWGSSIDGYLHLYEEPFDATMPLNNCIEANDDYRGRSGSQVVVDLDPGANVAAIMSSFSAGVTGSWTLTVSAP